MSLGHMISVLEPMIVGTFSSWNCDMSSSNPKKLNQGQRERSRIDRFNGGQSFSRGGPPGRLVDDSRSEENEILENVATKGDGVHKVMRD